jgi:hypothetical protein
VGWNWLLDKSGSTVGAKDDFKTAADDTQMPKDPAQTAIERICKRWVYDTTNDCFHDTLKVLDISKEGFNALYAVGDDMLAQYAVKAKDTTAALCLNHPNFVRVDGSTYLPGGHDPSKRGLPLVIDGDRVLVNRWRPSDLKAKDGDATPWLNLMEKLFPEPAVRSHVLDYMAYVAQNPGKKIGHAMIWYSQEQGVGKDLALEPLLQIVGLRNVAKIDPDDLSKPFTDYLGKQVIVCNEMMNFEKASIYNRIKSYLEMSVKWLTVNPKYGKKYNVLNNHIWVFCTNHANAVSLEVGDRRFFVCDCPSIVFAGQPVDDLIAWYQNGGYEIVFGFLKARDVSHFKPGHPPPMTAAKEEMVELAKHPFDRWCDDQFGHRELITVPEIKTMGRYGSADDAPAAAIAAMLAKGEEFRIIKWLKVNKFEALPNRIRIEGSVPTTVWARSPRPEIKATSGEFLAQRLAADRAKKRA